MQRRPRSSRERDLNRCHTETEIGRGPTRPRRATDLLEPHPLGRVFVGWSVGRCQTPPPPTRGRRGAGSQNGNTFAKHSNARKKTTNRLLDIHPAPFITRLDVQNRQFVVHRHLFAVRVDAAAQRCGWQTLGFWGRNPNRCRAPPYSIHSLPSSSFPCPHSLVNKRMARE